MCIRLAAVEHIERLLTSLPTKISPRNAESQPLIILHYVSYRISYIVLLFISYCENTRKKKRTLIDKYFDKLPAEYVHQTVNLGMETEAGQRSDVRS